mgnify:CR=1 FL=1
MPSKKGKKQKIAEESYKAGQRLLSLIGNAHYFPKDASELLSFMNKAISRSPRFKTEFFKQLIMEGIQKSPKLMNEWKGLSKDEELINLFLNGTEKMVKIMQDKNHNKSRIKLEKLDPELEKQLPESVRALREFYFGMSEQAKEKLANPGKDAMDDKKEVKSTKFCFECGAKINRIAKFCEECGTKQPPL